jgi:hypothetical protein
VDTGHVYAFYEKNILDIMDRLERKLPWTFRDQDKITIILLKENTACYNLIQALYETLPKDLIHGPKNTISAIYEEAHPAPAPSHVDFKTWLLTPKLFKILKVGFEEDVRFCNNFYTQQVK